MLKVFLAVVTATSGGQANTRAELPRGRNPGCRWATVAGRASRVAHAQWIPSANPALPAHPPPYSASLLCSWPPRGLLTGDSRLGALLAAATPDDIFGWQLGVGDATGS